MDFADKVVKQLKKGRIFYCKNCGIVLEAREGEWLGDKVYICTECGWEMVPIFYDNVPLFLGLLRVLIETSYDKKDVDAAKKVLQLFEKNVDYFVKLVNSMSDFERQQFLKTLKYFADMGFVSEKVLLAISI